MSWPRGPTQIRRPFENRTGKHHKTSPFRTYSRFRLAFRSISAGWEFDVWHRWHYPPFWTSAATHTLQSLLLHDSHHLPDLHRDNVLSKWLTNFRSTTPASPADGKQSAWDKPVIAANVAAVRSHFCDSFNTARLLAASAPHSDDWFKFDNEAIRIAVGLLLGVNLCEPHQCPCGKLVDAGGTHGLSCKRGTARAIRHHQLNDIVRCALVRANIPSVLEPFGLSRGYGNRPDCMTLIPWQGGKMSPWTSPVVNIITYPAQFVRMDVCVLVRLLVRVFIRQSSVRPSVHPAVRSSIWMCVYLSVCM